MRATVAEVLILADMSFTVAEVADGETTVPVHDMGSFNEDGGRVQLGYDGPVVTYTAALSDGTGDRLILTTGLDDPLADRTPLYVWPKRVRKVVRFYPVDEPDGDTMPAEVEDPAIWADTRLAEGSEGGQTIEVSRRRRTWLVDGIIGSPPRLDSATLDPATTVPAAVVTSSMSKHRDQWDHQVPPELLADGDITALLNILSKLTFGSASGAPITADLYGLRSLDGDGNPKTVQSTDPGLSDTTRGNGEFDQVSIVEGAVHGVVNIVPGGSLNLLSFVQPPPVAPTAVPSWPAVTIDFPPEVAPADRRGLAIKNFAFPLTQAYSLWIRPGNQRPKLLVFNPGTGAFTGAFNFPAATTDPGVPYGVGYDDNHHQIMTLHLRPSGVTPWVVRRWTFDGTALTFVSEWTWTAGTATGPQPAFAVADMAESPSVFIARADDAGLIHTWRYNATGALQHAEVSAVMVDPARADLAGVGLHTAHLPFMQRISNGQFQIVDSVTDGSDIAVEATPPVAYGDPVICGCSKFATGTDQHFFHLSGASNTMYQYQGWWPWTVLNGAASWYDHGTDTETKIGPVAVIEVVPCSSITLSVGAAPAGADAVRFYLGAPDFSAFLFSQGITDAGVTSLTVTKLVLSGSHPLDSPTLAAPPDQVGDIKVNGVAVITADGDGTIDIRIADLETLVAGLGGSLGVDDEIYIGSDYIDVLGRV